MVPSSFPQDLPCLEVLKLDFVDENPGYYWQQLSTCRYPKLKRVDITVSTYAHPEVSLKLDILMAFFSGLLNLESITLSRCKRDVPLDRSNDLKKRPISEELQERLHIDRRQPSFEAEEVKLLMAFAKKRKIECNCNIQD